MDTLTREQILRVRDFTESIPAKLSTISSGCTFVLKDYMKQIEG
ncbi:hypothetical protein LX66_1860 [Chitinophaga japonensis]|uniref:Uncharacterized protein n=1 Tax=Chitinophaga japonensis TaxID=104662 RepID=A0A562T286_CHIJA|nr:hypothetical protein LX66_1860 [Chitinophaga japonensis]